MTGQSPHSHGDASFADWYQTSKHWISMHSMRMAKMFEKLEEMLFRKAFDMYGLILNPLVKFSS